jgi:hypothetical protein
MTSRKAKGEKVKGELIKRNDDNVLTNLIETELTIYRKTLNK